MNAQKSFILGFLMVQRRILPLVKILFICLKTDLQFNYSVVRF